MMPALPVLRRAFLRGMLQACVLSCIGLILALLVNNLRDHGLPIFHTQVIESIRPADMGPPVSPPEAYRFFQSRTALFLDARAPQAFSTGHIPGALNIMPGTSLNASKQLKTAGNQTKIIYCEGPECDLAGRLAEELCAAGYEGVRIMTDGWPAWEGSGYPVEGQP